MRAAVVFLLFLIGFHCSFCNIELLNREINTTFEEESFLGVCQIIAKTIITAAKIAISAYLPGLPTVLGEWGEVLRISEENRDLMWREYALELSDAGGEKLGDAATELCKFLDDKRGYIGGGRVFVLNRLKQSVVLYKYLTGIQRKLVKTTEENFVSNHLNIDLYEGYVQMREDLKRGIITLTEEEFLTAFLTTYVKKVASGNMEVRRNYNALLNFFMIYYDSLVQVLHNYAIPDAIKRIEEEYNCDAVLGEDQHSSLRAKLTATLKESKGCSHVAMQSYFKDFANLFHTKQKYYVSTGTLYKTCKSYKKTYLAQIEKKDKKIHEFCSFQEI